MNYIIFLLPLSNFLSINVLKLQLKKQTAVQREPISSKMVIQIFDTYSFQTK